MQKPKRILILGPESTGKSTLAEDLAKYFNEPWVPEYARDYLEKINRPYEFEDLVEIGKGQMQQEDMVFQSAKNFLFCDTDLRVIHIWSEHRFGKTDPWVLEEIRKRTYDLIMLTNTDLAWEPDPLREHPDPQMRNYFFEKYLELAKESGFPWVDIRGERKERLSRAINALKSLI